MAILTKISPKDFQDILSAYNIGTYKRHRYITWSLKNTLYIIYTSKGKFVIKIFENTDADAFIYQLKLMKTAQRYKVPVPKTIKTKSGKDFAIYNSKILILEKYVEGKHPKRFTSNLTRQVARHQATFNKAFRRIKLENKYNWGGDYHFSLMNFRKKKKFLWFDAKKEEKKILEELKLLDKTKLRRSAVHGDFDLINLLVKNGELKAVLDWDDAHEDYLIYDCACIIASSFVSETKVHKEQIRLYFSEYQKIFKLNKEEVKAIYYFIKQRFIGSISWHLNMIQMHKDIIEGVLQVVLRIMEQYKNFSKIRLDEFQSLA